MPGNWTLDDIDWDRFESAAATEDAQRIVRASCMVEHNADDYAAYLCNVFADDPEFCAATVQWAAEEVQHGMALRRWAETADPGWDFDAAFAEFRAGFSVPLDVDKSVRGSRTGELLARCVVEVGTSSFYSAIRDATEEPVLKQICARIAGDEFRHYRLFYTHLKRYREIENIGALASLRVALGRLLESNDDELAFAYYAGNRIGGRYSRRRFARAYAARAYAQYRYGHVARGTAMTFKAMGFEPQGWAARTFAKWAYRFMHFQARRLAERAA